jgi:hypothetical protein
MAVPPDWGHRMNTRRYPRTLEDAFGPYQRSSQCEFVPMAPPTTPRHEWALYAVAIAAAAVVWWLA